MTQMLSILLQQQQGIFQISKTNKSQLTKHNETQNIIRNSDNSLITCQKGDSLEKTTWLVYRLLKGEKIKLLDKLFDTLRKEQRKQLEKQFITNSSADKKVNNNNKMSRGGTQQIVQYGRLLERMDFVQMLEYAAGEQENFILINRIPIQSVLRMTVFFVDWVFTQRRIRQQQVDVLSGIVERIKREHKQGMTISSSVVGKLQLVVKLASQAKTKGNSSTESKQVGSKQQRDGANYNQRGENLSKINYNESEQQKQQLKWFQYQSQLIDQKSESLADLFRWYLNKIGDRKSFKQTDMKQLHQYSGNDIFEQIINRKHMLLPQLIRILGKSSRQNQKYQQKLKKQSQQLQQQLQSILTNIQQLIQHYHQQLQLEDVSYQSKQTKKQGHKHQYQRKLKLWLGVQFLQQLIRYAIYQCTQQTNLLLATKTTAQIQINQQQQYKWPQFILSTINTYEIVLDFIQKQLLEENLFNDIKNNYYLSEEKLSNNITDLLLMACLWLQQGEYNQNDVYIRGQQEENRRTKHDNQCRQLLKDKLLPEVIKRKHNTNNSSTQMENQINKRLKAINQKIGKISQCLGLDTDDQKTEVNVSRSKSSKLLTIQQYTEKNLVNAIRKISSGIRLVGNANQQEEQSQMLKRINSVKFQRLFRKWFVEGTNQEQKTMNQRKQNNYNRIRLRDQSYLMLLGRINGLKELSNNQKNQQQIIYQLLDSLLCIPKKLNKGELPNSDIQSHNYNNKLIQSRQTKTQQFPAYTFRSFHSPTFKHQYLSFNYIYGQMKDVYFYHNHHYSHFVLTVYQMLIDELVRRVQQQQKNKDYEGGILTIKAIMNNVFNVLRNNLGQYAKDHLLQANSVEFYQYLNLFKFASITFTKTILSMIELDQLVLTFDLILNQILIKENHPLIRQYIQVIMARVYFVIKEKCKCKNNETFYQLRNRMINMLQYDEENVHNLNIGVPILMLLGYELISYVEENNPMSQAQRQIHSHNQNHNYGQNNNNQQFADQFGSKQIKTLHQLDIHYVLVKYISCHVAYMRTISQYYLSKYITLMKNQHTDVLLQNLVSFWHSDKDSFKIMTNISVAIQGFKHQMTLFNNKEKINSFYLCFERVQQQPKLYAQYFLTIDTIEMLKKLANASVLKNSYKFKILAAQKVMQLKQKAVEIKKKLHQQQINKSTNNDKKPTTTKAKQCISKTTKKEKQPKQHKKQNSKQLHKLKLEEKQRIIDQKQQELQQQVNTETQKNTHVQKIDRKIVNVYIHYQQIHQPNVIIIATLLEKVHNFGYLVRTLTNHNAMLTVPSSQPFLHPQCKELLPRQEDIDVKVIQVREKHLQSFIRMYQQRGYPLIALEQCSKSITLQKTVFPQKYMLLLGNQRIGAPASLLNMADILVQIPQVGKIRSLNVHVSMVICFWEYLKQKNNTQQQQKDNINKSKPLQLQTKK